MRSIHDHGNALRESEESYRTLFENSTIGLYRTTPDGRVLMANPALVKMLGYASFEELASRDLEKEGFESAYERKLFIDLIEAQEEIRDFEAAWRRSDGSVLYITESARAVRDASGKTLYYDGTVKDITQRKITEEQLRLSEQTYRGMLDSLTEAVYIKDERGVIIDVNLAVQKLYGYAKEELIGRTIEFLSPPAGNDLSKIQACLEKAFRGDLQSFEFLGQRKDGTTFPVDINLSPGFYFGKQVVIAVARDITERKAIDRLMGDVQRRESIGILSTGIAHDFNNLLGVMMGHVSLAQTQLPADHPAAQHMEKALSAMESAAELTRQMLAYSGKGKYQVRKIDLGEEIQKHISLFSVSMPKNVKLVARLPSAPVCINGDPGQIKQVIMNLIINGGDAIGNRPGTVTVALSARALGSDELQEYGKITAAPLQEGEYAVLEVTDNGIGMKQETLQQIFDPFFTTKFIGRGLGLSAVLGIIRSHGGGIAIDSTEGKGTTFRIILPAVPAHDTAGEAPAPDERPVIAAERSASILVIDDEPDVAAVVKDILETINYRVLIEVNPLKGIELFRDRHREIDVVLLDLTMPEMSGKDVMESLRAIDPDVKVIISSGYSETEMQNKIGHAPVSGFIQKPYRVETLVAMIQKAL
jgi:PAS domain S-box-containing protein